MSVAATAVTASMVVGLFLPPSRRYFAWAATACSLLLLLSIAFALLSAGLLLSGDWNAPVYTICAAVAVLFPAYWIGRTADYPEPPPPTDEQDDAEDDSGGGGGGPPKPPPEPEPGPSAPELDWDAFDDVRELWGAPAPEPAVLPDDDREPALV